MRHLLASFLFAIVAPFAAATTFSTDATDLWWIPAQSGWGANVIQQGDTLFVTLFAYGADNRPTWFVGPAMTHSRTDSSGVVYAGSWLQTAGPWFGGTFDPNNVTNRTVGSATFTLDTATTATLAYSVDGVSVTRNVVRQTWRNNNLVGDYMGAMIGNSTGCGSDNGYEEEDMTFSITHSGASVAMTFRMSGDTCNVAATHSQAGKMGTIAGSLSCATNSGTFEGTEIEANRNGITGRFRTQLGSCVQQGRFGGIRRG